MPKKIIPRAETPILAPRNPPAWAAWLASNHSSSTGVWLQLDRQRAPEAAFCHPQALEIALCYGWIDGQSRPRDSTTWMVRFTPRRSRSPWSQLNRLKALALIRAGRMKPSGHRAIEAAKGDGRWQRAYPPQSRAKAPEDLVRALQRYPRARAFFEELNSHNRFAILYRLQESKRPETRQRRLEKFVAMLRRGETLHRQATRRRISPSA